MVGRARPDPAVRGRQCRPGGVQRPHARGAALRELLKERHAEDQAYVPARVLNLVLVVDREWRGEIVNRLERVGRYHPSRTVLCEVEAGRTTLDARATM